MSLQAGGDLLSKLIQEMRSRGERSILMAESGEIRCGEEGEVLRQLETKELQMLLRSLQERCAPWPDDAVFSINPRRRRILLAPAAGPRTLSEVSTKLSSRDVVLTTVQTEEDGLKSVQELFGPDDAALRGLKLLASLNAGIVIASSAEKDPSLSQRQPTVDARALLLAARPEMLVANDFETEDAQRVIIEAAQRSLVLIDAGGADALQMLLDVKGAFEAHSDLEKMFCERLTLCFVHKRVKRVCESCARPTVVSAEVRSKLPPFLAPEEGATYLFGRGCERCGQLSYRGTIGLDSVCLVDRKLRSLLSERAAVQELVEASYQAGTRALLEDGMLKLRAGLTSFEEILAVAPLPSIAYAGIAVKKAASAAPLPLADMNVNKVSSLLIVEDDADQRGVLEVVFRSAGYDVWVAENGRRALELLQNREADVIVCDLMMPEMDGERFVQELRRLGARTPVLMLTAIENPEKEIALLERGADDYCVKNIKRKLLLKRVEKLLSDRGSGMANPVMHLLNDSE